MSSSRQKPVSRSVIAQHHRHAAVITTRTLLHPAEKQALRDELPRRERKVRGAELEARWQAEERAAAEQARGVVDAVRGAVVLLDASLRQLRDVQLRVVGAIEAELERTRIAAVHLDAAEHALAGADFGTAGREVEAAVTELAIAGRGIAMALNQALAAATMSRGQRLRIETNLGARRALKADVAAAHEAGRPQPDTLVLESRVYQLTAEGFAIAAEILGQQPTRQETAGRHARVGREGEVLVVPPAECETFADVGGLDEIKERLRTSVGVLVERPEAAARYQVIHNGILFHGPPGVGKSLLGRALAGEYGLRYIRVSPFVIASPYAHESAANVRHVFRLARDSVPCLLFLDEIDAIAGDRSEQPSAERREVVTELMTCLEEFRAVPGLVIVAATNAIDALDPGLREGRFDTRIPIGLPDAASRAEILRVHLLRRTEAVAWDELDLTEVASMTGGGNAAALESIVTLAAQYALADDRLIGGEHMRRAVRDRAGRERHELEEGVGWEDVVLADEVRTQLQEILNVFLHPDLAQKLGVKPPVGLLLHGPPGTGKTTIASAIAAQTATSFYHLSAAELVSKWAGESEQRVARLFNRARAHRPAIIVIDEIDALLRRRGRETTVAWEERVVSQFFQELDALRNVDGVLLIGATNRIDILDEAATRRLLPVEIGLPDVVMRVRLLQLLCRGVNLADDVNLRAVAAATGGMSGADLRRVRDAAGMKALSRMASAGVRADEEPAIMMADFQAALSVQRARESLAVI